MAVTDDSVLSRIRRFRAKLQSSGINEDDRVIANIDALGHVAALHCDVNLYKMGFA